VEVMASLILLAFVSLGVFVVVTRSLNTAADSAQRIRAFEVARENMEQLLAADSVSEMAEYGSSDKYSGISWQKTVETFFEPVTNRMWLRGVCSAEYLDSQNKTQRVELTHWLTDLTKEQLVQIMQEKAREKQDLSDANEIPPDPNAEPPGPNTPPGPNQPEDDDLYCGYSLDEIWQQGLMWLLNFCNDCPKFGREFCY